MLFLLKCDFFNRALCCLAFYIFLCSVFKVQLRVACTLKIEQCKKFEKADLGCYTRLVTL